MFKEFRVASTKTHSEPVAVPVAYSLHIVVQRRPPMALPPALNAVKTARQPLK
ncbi:conserved hypothetical protein [Ricinus communis]|uniref:Uncharacterized protein n=1 Tax=Ricinus communis TaxID=3988 RepID=B9S1E5_RICCO|nr:conserved hypothetical protein [Ricinus communis]